MYYVFHLSSATESESSIYPVAHEISFGNRHTQADMVKSFQIVYAVKHFRGATRDLCTQLTLD
jgi:hypothetical protein